jgi:hypothetical protein
MIKLRSRTCRGLAEAIGLPSALGIVTVLVLLIGRISAVAG